MPQTTIKLKSGKEEIVYLLDQVFLKFEKESGTQVRRNTNRKNYEDLARILSKISNQLPYTAETLQHTEYAPDRNSGHLSYPNLKYDITGGQIKDAGNGMVSNPRSFLVDACYIYLFGRGRKGFEKDPCDHNLLLDGQKEIVAPTIIRPRKTINWSIFVILSMGVLIGILAWHIISLNKHIKNDLRIGVYRPSEKEVARLEGVWLVYISSPQARKSETNRYHLTVTNIISVKYVDGRFTFERYGASFNHTGFMQYENSDVISVRSYLSTGRDGDTTEYPRVSLFKIDPKEKYQSVISASWNFDTDRYKDVIGIREVYVKLADHGTIEEVLNTIENSICKCKIVALRMEKRPPIKYYLKNMNIDSISDPKLRELLDEHSILLRKPDTTTLITHK